MQELEDVVTEWGSSFNYIHTSAAFTKAAKLAGSKSAKTAGGRPAAATAVTGILVRTWDQLYAQSDAQGLANVLWACSKLRVVDAGLWKNSVEVFLGMVPAAGFQSLANVVYGLAVIAASNKGSVPGMSMGQVRQALTSIMEHAYVLSTHPSLDGIAPQGIGNMLWGCGSLGVYPGDRELTALVHALLRQQLSEAATVVDWCNIVYALGQLQLVHTLQGAIDQHTWGKVLSDKLLGKLSNSYPQAVANTLLAMSCLATTTSTEPAIDLLTAQHCAMLLLQGRVSADLASWNSQNLSNSLYAYAKLQLQCEEFLSSLIARITARLPTASVQELKQLAWACSLMHLHDVQFMSRVIKRSKQVLQQSHAKSSFTTVCGLAAVVSSSVVQLNMQSLASDVVARIGSPAVQGQLDAVMHLKTGDASMLWQVHSWLVAHALLDGKGLSKYLSAEQLALGREAYEKYLSV